MNIIIIFAARLPAWSWTAHSQVFPDHKININKFLADCRTPPPPLPHILETSPQFRPGSTQNGLWQQH